MPNLFRLTTPFAEAQRQAESFEFSWTYLAMMVGIILLTWLVIGDDFRRKP